MRIGILDYLVIGAGPAGLQLGALLREAGHQYRILEAGHSPGTFFRTFPRHRQLLSINKPNTGDTDPEKNLRTDWNSLLSADPRLLFTRYTQRYFPHASDLAYYLADFAAAQELNITYDTRVVRISGAEGEFTVTDQDGVEYLTRRVVMATGVSRPHLPDIPGIELADPYASVSVDSSDFVGQRVLIIGKGNSALETADNLVETAAVIHVAGPGAIRLAWDSHHAGHLRAVNTSFLDTCQLNSQNALLDGEVRAIEARGAGYLVRFAFAGPAGDLRELRYDRVIVCTGFRFDGSVFDRECTPELVAHDGFAALTPAYESVNVPGLYFAGTLMRQRDPERSSAFIAGFRYLIRALTRVLDQRYHGRPWPHRLVPEEPAALADAVLSRVNRSSALWLQPGVLCDLLVVAPGEPARYLEELPVDYAIASHLTGDADYLMSTLEYALPRGSGGRYPIPASLHPVLRHYRGGVLMATHRLAENLEHEWRHPRLHRAALTEFIAARHGQAAVPAASAVPAISAGR